MQAIPTVLRRRHEFGCDSPLWRAAANHRSLDHQTVRRRSG